MGHGYVCLYGCTLMIGIMDRMEGYRCIRKGCGECDSLVRYVQVGCKWRYVFLRFIVSTVVGPR